MVIVAVRHHTGASCRVPHMLARPLGPRNLRVGLLLVIEPVTILVSQEGVLVAVAVCVRVGDTVRVGVRVGDAVVWASLSWLARTRGT